MKTIIFDMDGTLIDSGTVIADTINFVRGNFGLEPLQKACLLENVNNPDVHPPRYFYEVDSYSAKHIELFETYYHANYLQKVALYDGIFDILDYFNRDFRYTIATNANKKTATQMVRHLEIEHFFELIVGADCVKNSKPHPDMVLKILSDLDIKKEDAILIGDSQKDIMAAKSAGVESILVNWGFTKHNDAVTCIDDLKTVLKRF